MKYFTLIGSNENDPPQVTALQEGEETRLNFGSRKAKSGDLRNEIWSIYLIVDPSCFVGGAFEFCSGLSWQRII